MDFHRQRDLARSKDWGDVRVRCICGWSETRPTAWQAMVVYEAHSHDRPEPVPAEPHTAVSDMFRDQGGPGPLGAAYQAVRTHAV